MKRVSVFLILVALVAGMLGCAPPPTPIPIGDWYDLDDVRDNLGDSYILMNDLNSTTPGYDELASPTANGGKGWYPIGIFSQGGGWRFTGTLDGQGHEICDLFIDRPFPEAPDNGTGIGLVGVLGQGGVVENISVVNVTVIGTCYVGGLVGYSCGTVSNSYCTGNVTGSANVAGLVGCSELSGTVSNSYSTASVTGSDAVGGLVGALGSSLYPSESTVSNSYSTGNVTGVSNVGGLVGKNEGSAPGVNFRGSVRNSFWDIQTSGQSTSAGGTGKSTAEMKDMATFSGAAWEITAVADPGVRNPSYIWNIVSGVTYPFLSWQP